MSVRFQIDWDQPDIWLILLALFLAGLLVIVEYGFPV
jgi:hypothetical protein